jgi:hypothetical protein
MKEKIYLRWNKISGRMEILEESVLPLYKHSPLFVVTEMQELEVEINIKNREPEQQKNEPSTPLTE